ncbi:beta-propeller fold lactonase family protein [Kibdelosporangium aridum]|uniref:beta-propeller fold lactonase family protein n=1 Tax=Kibdelosporangium aridum TaxID=2030 RepID=UPI0035E543B4
MVASAYVDDLLGPREGRDTLSTIPLTGNGRPVRAYETEVSNSVAGAPSAVAVSPNGRYAFVAETFRQATPQQQRFSDLQPGRTLTVVDIGDPTAPRDVQRLDLGTRLETVEVNPAGDMVAVPLHPSDGRGIAFTPFRNGRLGTPQYVQFPGIASTTRMTHVSWHPSGTFIAAALADIGSVTFAKVQRQGDAVTLQPWANQVLVGKYPFKVAWTPDGRHVLANNLQWGPDVVGFWTEAPRGSVVSVRLSDKPAEIPNSLVSVAETGVSPEGVAISPDGRFVVTANLERSYVPTGDARKTWHSSLSLLTFEQSTGRLQRVGDYPFDGILPETAIFDASSRYLAVTNYDHFDDAKPGGTIDFWRIDSDPLNPRPLLVRTENSVPVTRGPHSMVLVR